MKKCNIYIKKADNIDRYCSMKCDSGNCVACVMNDAKSLIFKMAMCKGEECSEECEQFLRFKKISGMVGRRLLKVR